MTESVLSQALLTWYEQHARKLPWRGHPDAYAVWVSEIMLQQTRIETVIPYFERWMNRFPTIPVLAQAPQQEVLSAWEGLGYYSRALNLQRAAQLVMEQYGGQLPDDVQALRRLPGIGRYTAGAISAIAFGHDEPALDGNIRRVLARVFDVSLPARTSAGERRLWQLAGENLPTGRAGDYLQAMMDLGATLCTPRKPDCAQCPLHELCLARRAGIQEQRPVLKNRPPPPHYTVTAAVIANQDRVLITQRPAKGLLGGMWEFPGGKLETGEDLVECLRREILEELGVSIQVVTPFGVYQHAYTHFKVTLHAFCCTITNGSQPRPMQVKDLCWAPIDQLAGFPMGKIDRQIARRLVESSPC